MLQLLRDLATHCQWADGVFFHTWGKGPARDQEELRQRVGHILGVQQGFVSVLRGESPQRPPGGPAPSFDDLKAWAPQVHAEFGECLAQLDDAGLARQVTIPWIPDPPCVIPVSDAILQTVMHAQHHRGQCMTRLKDFGGEPKNVDYIIWVWRNKPAPRWA